MAKGGTDGFTGGWTDARIPADATCFLSFAACIV